LPRGYDHKYVYSHLGYNLKPLDVQAAIGRAQLAKLDGFLAARRANWSRLRHLLADLEGPLAFMLPTNATAWSGTGFSWSQGRPACDPSWFGFMLLVRPGGRIDRTGLARALDKAKIGNRMLFGGNLVRQPAFTRLRDDSDGRALRVVGDLAGSDILASQALFIGVYPGLTAEQIDYMASVVRAAVAGQQP
jgi:CDP-6-deoxy-D-xylo-4-hexulose-3-dehydrase